VKEVLKFSVSVLLTNKSNGFIWKLVVVYGPAYDDLRQDFLDELEVVMGSWKGPIMIGGDFNLVRFASDKSNGIYSHRWAGEFNDWISKWALMELNPSNKRFTWTNNQDNPILAKIDRIFVSGSWDAAFPLASVKALERIPSDHNPLVVNSGVNSFFGKKRFSFEKWWLQKESFKSFVEKAWRTPCSFSNSIDRWQFRVRTLRRMIRGWAANEVAAQNKSKVELSKEFTRLEGLAEVRSLSDNERRELGIIEDKLEQI